eukprot:scaffold323546_cov19-Prasinocladus_malaysianus.AAC.1
MAAQFNTNREIYQSDHCRIVMLASHSSWLMFVRQPARRGMLCSKLAAAASNTGAMWYPWLDTCMAIIHT